jgi:hypothetical protein
MAGLGPAIHADRHTDAHLRSWMPRPSPGMTLMGSDALILPRRHCDPGLNPGSNPGANARLLQMLLPDRFSRALKRWYEQTAARFPTLINKVSP